MWFSFFITWEQRKLGEAANIYDGVHQTPDYKDSGIMFLSVENISTLKSRKYISEEAFTRDYKVYPQKGDILMTRIGDVGTPNVVESTEKLAFYVSLALLKPINVDSYFLCNSILSPLFQRGLKERTLVTAIPQKINKDEIGKVSFFVPNSRDEQKQIGTFFANLDNLITLHQRKQNLGFRRVDGKKSFLILANDWEQRKLGDIFERIVRKNVNNESSLPLTISAQDGLVDQITYFNNRVASRDVSNYYLVLNGEFAYNKSTSDGYPYGAVKRLDLYEKGVLSTLYIVFALKDDAKTDSDYMAVFFDTDRWHRGVAERAAEGARNHGLLNIAAKDFFDISIFLPRSIGEQQKIGRVLKRLDNLITLHQRKLNSCCEYKAEFSNLQKCDELANDWEQRKFGDVFSYERPDKYIVESDKYSDFYSTPVLTANKGFVLGYTNEKRTYNTPCVIFDDFTLDSKYVDFPFMVKSSALKILTTKQGYYLPFAYELLHAANIEVLGHARHYISVVQPTMVLVPNYSEQLRVGKFIEAIDNLITLHQCKLSRFFSIKNTSFSCRTRAEDTFAWEQRKVQDVADRYDNLRIPVAANLRVSGNIPYYGANGIQDYVDGFTHEGEFVLVAEDGANDLKNYPVQHVQGRIWVNNHAHVLQGKPALMNNLFLAYSLHRADIASFLVGGSRAKLNADTLMTLELLLPSVEEQTKIGITLAAVDNLITLHQRGEKYITGDEHDKRHKTK